MVSDSELLNYFLTHDCMEYFKDQRIGKTEIWEVAFRDLLGRLKHFADEGDVREFILHMSFNMTAYFPETDFLFPHWWER